MFKSVNKTLVCDHSNECYWPLLLCGYYLLGCYNFGNSAECLPFSVVSKLSINCQLTKCQHITDSQPAVNRQHYVGQTLTQNTYCWKSK